MEKDPNSQINNVGENTTSPYGVLENMPSYEEHMKSFESQREVEQNNESGERQKSRQELKDRFIFDGYGGNCSFRAALAHYERVQNDSYESGLDEIQKAVSRSSIPLIDQIARMIRKTVSSQSERVQAIKKLDPRKIEREYGAQVEEWGVSLADVNRVLEYGYHADNPYGFGIMLGHEDTSTTPYEYFCNNLSNVIEKHFSDRISTDHKQMMSSVIEKITHCDDESMRQAYYSGDFSEEEIRTRYGDSRLRREVDFSESEIDFLAKTYSEANKNVGNSFNDIRIIAGGHGTKTDDKLLDAIMYRVYKGDNVKFHNSEIGKKMKEYME